jgi:phosphatidylserine/phosphatidylglycerophosphate/cardiolipin synthase-like enzyme
MSGGRWPEGLPAPPPVSPPPGGGTRVQLLTESRIRDALLASLAAARSGDQVDVAVFYLSHRGLVRELVAARKRGVVLRVLLDPNRDAFGRLKNGIPNRQAALELHQAGVPVRWCETHGEQCHAKFLLRRSEGDESELIVGSANYTRRNLDDYNLESSLRVLAPGDATVSVEAARYFEQAWSNGDGRRISVPYPAFEDRSQWHYWRYRFTEATGLSSF